MGDACERRGSSPAVFISRRSESPWALETHFFRSFITLANRMSTACVRRKCVDNSGLLRLRVVAIATISEVASFGITPNALRTFTKRIDHVSTNGLARTRCGARVVSIYHLPLCGPARQRKRRAISGRRRRFRRTQAGAERIAWRSRQLRGSARRIGAGRKLVDPNASRRSSCRRCRSDWNRRKSWRCRRSRRRESSRTASCRCERRRSGSCLRQSPRPTGLGRRRCGGRCSSCKSSRPASIRCRRRCCRRCGRES